MPHHVSAKKRLRTNKKSNIANRIKRSVIRTLTRKVRETEDPEQAAAALRQLVSSLDKAEKTNICHKNQVARRKSRAQKRINSLTASS
ncbi:MAG: 30S ribosomal protein S20 [Candidatus Eisenbacteria bacterium]|nr:30S ribosomal protein S20 [Candidatus Eisenbacteria bacterium]